MARTLHSSVVSSLGCALALALLASPAWSPRARAEEPQAATAEDPQLAALEEMAEAAYVQDDLETAIALYRQLAHEQDGVDETTRALMTAASLEHYRGRTDRALEILGQVLRLDPDYPFRPELYSEDFAPLFFDAQRRSEDERVTRSAKLVSEGVEAMRRDEEATARAAFEEALALAPGDAAAIYNLALLDLRDERLDDAMGGFQKVIALHAAEAESVTASTLAKSLTNAGMIHLRQENWPDAATALERAVEIDPENRVAWSNLGIARRALERPAAAADAFRRAYELDADDPGTIALLAASYLDAGDAASAVDLLEGAAERFPQRADLRLHLGRAQHRLDRHDDAVRSLERALGSDAENEAGIGVEAALELTLVHQRTDHPQASLDAAERVLEWRPDSVDALVYQGLARESLGNLEGARESFETARRLAPERSEIHLNLGTVLYRQGLYAQAETAYRRALDLNPDSRAARRNLDAARTAQTTAATPPSRRTESSAATRSPTRSPSPAPSQRQSTADENRRVGESSRPAGRRAASVGLVFSRTDYSALGIEGAMVESIRGGTPAARAGLRDGDLLLRLAGETLRSPAHFEELLGRLPSGRRVTLELRRDDRPLRVEIEIP